MSEKIAKTNHYLQRVKIGEIIAEIRLDKKLTQFDLAKLAGMKQPHLANIEKGDINFSIDTLLDIAAALDVSAAYILLKALWNGKDIIIEQAVKDNIIKDIVTSVAKCLR